MYRVLEALLLMPRSSLRSNNNNNNNIRSGANVSATGGVSLMLWNKDKQITIVGVINFTIIKNLT